MPNCAILSRWTLAAGARGFVVDLPFAVAGKFTNAAGTGVTEAVEITGAKFQEAGVDGDAVWISLGLCG